MLVIARNFKKILEKVRQNSLIEYLSKQIQPNKQQPNITPVYENKHILLTLEMQLNQLNQELLYQHHQQQQQMLTSIQRLLPIPKVTRHEAACKVKRIGSSYDEHLSSTPIRNCFTSSIN